MAKVLWKLRQDHKNMARLLDLVRREIDAQYEGRSPDYFLIESILKYTLNFPDLCHHPLEDLVFEKLKLRDPEAAKVIGNLDVEHEKLGANVRRFAAAVRNIQDDHVLPRDWFVSVAAEYCDGLWRHMQMEEVLFFPPALRALTESDWTEIELKATVRDDPLFDNQADQEFAKLHKDIIEWSRMSEDTDVEREELRPFR